jgi:hypothetical protein
LETLKLFNQKKVTKPERISVELARCKEFCT